MPRLLLMVSTKLAPELDWLMCFNIYITWIVSTVLSTRARLYKVAGRLQKDLES